MNQIARNRFRWFALRQRAPSAWLAHWPSLQTPGAITWMVVALLFLPVLVPALAVMALFVALNEPKGSDRP